jgi:hypothetical protein
MLLRLFNIESGVRDLQKEKTRTNPHGPERHKGDQDTSAFNR